MKRLLVLISLFLLTFSYVFSQMGVIEGRVVDTNENPIYFANISIPSLSLGTSTNEKGYFKLHVPSKDSLSLVVSFVGFETIKVKLFLNDGERKNLKNIVLINNFNVLPAAEISSNSERLGSLVRLNPKLLMKIPTIGGFETLLKSLPQVSSSNELSSQYNVRGGNFDENLVFVNDVEIYRPILVRAGQQEGLSFINSDMISGIVFSAGGFEACYGDKMSSVLDIRYRKPNKFAGTATVSLLGSSLHLEGTSKNQLFRYNLGFRHKTTKYLLNTLESKGDYKPNFLDFQAYFTYDFSSKFELSLLSNFSRNNYSYAPTDRETSFGTMNEPIKMKMYFEGSELDRFDNSTIALIGTYRPNSRLNLKYIASGYLANETESYDILAQYFLNRLDSGINSNNIGDSVENIGAGSHLNHARNLLNGLIFSAKHLGEYKLNNNKIEWGMQFNRESFDYIIHEWTMIDSAGYSLPYDGSNLQPFDRDIVPMYSTDFSAFDISSNRINAFVQNNYLLELDNINMSFGGGIRFNYWNFNNEFLISPRFNMGIDPNWKRNLVFRLSTGIYRQPPFFKEVRRPSDGGLNSEIKSQSSYQIVLASDYIFKLWKRPFKLVTEVFYKYMWDLIPYDVDNVRIRYYGENLASGYAAGFETKINGEFVPGTESWFSFSFMKTMEDIKGDFSTRILDNGGVDTVFHGFIPRPTDQRVGFSVYFQDYIPKYPSWQVYLNILYNTGLPFGPPKSERHMATLRMKPYRRVDIGLSKRIMSGESIVSEKNPLRYIKSVWLSLEVFNMLGISNEVSYTWIQDVRGREYAVPNFLTGRRVNFKLHLDF